MNYTMLCFLTEFKQSLTVLYSLSNYTNLMSVVPWTLGSPFNKLDILVYNSEKNNEKTTSNRLPILGNVGCC